MNQTEFLYRLNLPSLDNVLISKDILKSYIGNLSEGSNIFYPQPSTIFKKEWLSFMGLDWDYVSLFVRSAGITGMIHRDNPNDPNSLHWGINWIIGDKGYMDYWLPEQFKEEKIIYDKGGKKTVNLYIDDPPYKEYKTFSGVYLINASMPHRVRNLSSNTRVALSLRSKKFRYDNPNHEWKDIVEMFKDIIQN